MALNTFLQKPSKSYIACAIAKERKKFLVNWKEYFPVLHLEDCLASLILIFCDFCFVSFSVISRNISGCQFICLYGNQGYILTKLIFLKK